MSLEIHEIQQAGRKQQISFALGLRASTDPAPKVGRHEPPPLKTITKGEPPPAALLGAGVGPLCVSDAPAAKYAVSAHSRSPGYYVGAH